MNNEHETELAREAQAALLTHGPQAGEVYRHYKGGEYVIICRSLNEGTLGDMVTYRSLEKGYTWTRPLKVFEEMVKPKLPRFTKVE